MPLRGYVVALAHFQNDIGRRAAIYVGLVFIARKTVKARFGFGGRPIERQRSKIKEVGEQLFKFAVLFLRKFSVLFYMVKPFR